MPKKKCPIAGYEAFEVEVSEPITVRDYDKFVRGMQTAQAEKKFDDNSSVNVARFYGCMAMVETTGAPAEDVEAWPLEVFIWFLDTVYYQRLDKALNPPKN